MSNEQSANVMFARRCLQNLCRDLMDTEAISLCNTLDQALRQGRYDDFENVCSDLRRIAICDTDPWRIRERIQAISLVRFPLRRLDPARIFAKQRSDVQTLRLHLSPSDRDVWRATGRLVSSVLNDMRPEPCDCSHGPGVVSETSDALKKRQVVYLAPSLRRYVHLIPDFPIRWKTQRSKSLLVPKDHKTLRVIASEPAWTQWVQQGFKTVMMRRIESAPRFRGHICFRDQTKQHTKLTQGMATIDLSNASDSVRMKHLLLLSLPLALRETLVSLRTVETEYRGVPYPTVGLYPMGAAVCFPFETLLFSALWVSYRAYESITKDRSQWGCFGDDLIVPAAYAGGFCNFLKRSGFSPNMGKTFIGTDFLESCGVYSYKGVNVTPLKLKKNPPVSSRDVNNITYSEYCDRCDLYPHLKGYLAKSVKDTLYLNPKIRWNSNYQRLERLTLKSTVRCITGHWSGYPEALLRGVCDIPRSVITTVHGWQPV